MIHSARHVQNVNENQAKIYLQCDVHPSSYLCYSICDNDNGSNNDENYNNIVSTNMIRIIILLITIKIIVFKQAQQKKTQNITLWYLDIKRDMFTK